jgi:hypothetical protein
MSRNLRPRLRLFISALVAVLATAAIGIATALADSGGPPIPR